jgi:hypothetical protein
VLARNGQKVSEVVPVEHRLAMRLCSPVLQTCGLRGAEARADVGCRGSPKRKRASIKLARRNSWLPE